MPSSVPGLCHLGLARAAPQGRPQPFRPSWGPGGCCFPPQPPVVSPDGSHLLVLLLELTSELRW